MGLEFGQGTHINTNSSDQLVRNSRCDIANGCVGTNIKFAICNLLNKNLATLQLGLSIIAPEILATAKGVNNDI